MKSVIIRVVAGLLLMIVGLFIFIDTFDIYPFKGYLVYECSLCGNQWNEFQELDGRITCKNYAKVVNPETGKKENVCKKKLCAVGVEDSKAAGNYVYVKNVTNHLIVNTTGGVLAIGGFLLAGVTVYRVLLHNSKKSDDE